MTLEDHIKSLEERVQRLEQLQVKCPMPPERAALIMRIRAAVCREFKLSERELISPSRLQSSVEARFVGFYVARKLTQATLQDIGKAFGRKDHACVSNGLERMETLLNVDAGLRVITAKLIVEFTEVK